MVLLCLGAGCEGLEWIAGEVNIHWTCRAQHTGQLVGTSMPVSHATDPTDNVKGTQIGLQHSTIPRINGANATGVYYLLHCSCGAVILYRLVPLGL